MASSPPPASGAAAANLALMVDLFKASEKWSKRLGAAATKLANALRSNSGAAVRWTHEEDTRLLEGLERFPNDWQRISEHVGTRSVSQIQSRLKRLKKKEHGDKTRTSSAYLSDQVLLDATLSQPPKKVRGANLSVTSSDASSDSMSSSSGSISGDSDSDSD